MGIFRRSKQDTSEGTFAGYNPSDEELAQMRADALAASPDIGRQAVQAAARLDILKQASDAQIPYVPKSVASGEVPLITPGMERPSDGPEPQERIAS